MQKRYVTALPDRKIADRLHEDALAARFEKLAAQVEREPWNELAKAE